MPHIFLILIALAVFRLASPTSTRSLEGAITALIFTFVPGTFLWLASWSYGWGLTYGISCALSSAFVALPLVIMVFKNS
jgi:ABC-type uncharacterized transport system involved in gliding motility auxiliary subunit